MKYFGSVTNYNDLTNKMYVDGVAGAADKNLIKYNAYNYFANEWEKGTITATTGANSTSSVRVRTENFVPENVIKLSISNVENTDYCFAVYAYSKLDNSYIGVWSGNELVQTSNLLLWQTEIYLNSIGDYKFRIVLRDRNETESLEIIEAQNLFAYTLIDKSFSLSDKLPDSKATGDYFKGLGNIFTEQMPIAYGAKRSIVEGTVISESNSYGNRYSMCFEMDSKPSVKISCDNNNFIIRDIYYFEHGSTTNGVRIEGLAINTDPNRNFFFVPHSIDPLKTDVWVVMTKLIWNMTEEAKFTDADITAVRSAVKCCQATVEDLDDVTNYGKIPDAFEVKAKIEDLISQLDNYAYIRPTNITSVEGLRTLTNTPEGELINAHNLPDNMMITMGMDNIPENTIINFPKKDGIGQPTTLAAVFITTRNSGTGWGKTIIYIARSYFAIKRNTAPNTWSNWTYYTTYNEFVEEVNKIYNDIRNNEISISGIEGIANIYHNGLATLVNQSGLDDEGIVITNTLTCRSQAILMQPATIFSVELPEGYYVEKVYGYEVLTPAENAVFIASNIKSGTIMTTKSKYIRITIAREDGENMTSAQTTALQNSVKVWKHIIPIYNYRKNPKDKVNELVAILRSYITANGDDTIFTYGYDGILTTTNPSTTVEGQTRYEIDCSTYVGLALRGLEYENTSYYTHQWVSPTFWTENTNYDWSINLYDYENQGHDDLNTVTHVREAAAIGLFYVMRGATIPIDPHYANIEAGDLLFFARTDENTGEYIEKDRFMCINHVGICTRKVRISNSADGNRFEHWMAEVGHARTETIGGVTEFIPTVRERSLENWVDMSEHANNINTLCLVCRPSLI